ncbi:MAG: amidophosphoribosyltransferase [Candidatus Pacebacteria bacterium]|nr:amidophosphoribosyltransferase [Candidatus Paceibacterota bacterium]
MEHLGEKCGIFGIYGKGLDVSRLSFFGLFSLQHRGQESSGITVGNGEALYTHRGMGLVSSAYTEEHLKRLQGFLAIGHNRYSTSGDSMLCHSQPIVIDEVIDVQTDPHNEDSSGGIVALAHNGNLPSVEALKEFLKNTGVRLDHRSDSELMTEAIAHEMNNGKQLQDAVKAVLHLFTGAYALVIATPTTLLAVRDGFGIRPLCLGKINGGFAVASESCAFKSMGATFMREIEPGEMVWFDEHGMRQEQVIPPTPKLDLFEFVYFARPDSTIAGKLVYDVRRNSGVELAREFKIKADIVVPVPETAIPVAIGFSAESGIPLEMALVKNRYIHRTFIEPEQHTRDLGVKLKLTPLAEVLVGKSVIIMDDSIVRGTTSRQLVQAIFEAGAKEVHFLISSPPVRFPDFYGIDTPQQKNLIASQKTVEEIREFLGATSLHFISLDGLVKATGLPQERFSTSCFTGEYPIDLHERTGDFTMEVPKN